MIQEMIDGMAVKINAEKAQNMLNELGLNLIRQFDTIEYTKETGRIKRCLFLF